MSETAWAVLIVHATGGESNKGLMKAVDGDLPPAGRVDSLGSFRDRIVRRDSLAAVLSGTQGGVQWDRRWGCPQKGCGHTA